MQYLEYILTHKNELSLLFDLITTIAVVVGVCITLIQLKQWRNEARTTKRSEVAEELISSAYNVSDALKHIRNPFSSIPKDKANDKRYSYEVRYKRITDTGDLFKELRQRQIRALAVIGDKDVDRSVNDLFNIRSEVATAIEMLADRAEESDYSSEDDETKALYKKLRRKMFGRYSEADEIWVIQERAIKTIDDKLRPIARLEAR